MQKHLSILVFFVLLLACSGNKGKPVRKILQTDEMVNILEDIHLAEAYVIDQHMSAKMSDSWLSYYYGIIYRIHDTDSAQFERSLAYYQSKPEELLELYDQVVTQLSIRQEAIIESLYNSEKSNQNENK